MWTLKKDFQFEAAHRLPKHQGKCARLHGHSYRMTIYVTGTELTDGMVIDYGEIGYYVKPFVDQYLDHHYLNETTGLENPTSEELARWVYQKLPLPSGIKLTAVEIHETCTTACLYQP